MLSSLKRNGTRYLRRISINQSTRTGRMLYNPRHFFERTDYFSMNAQTKTLITAISLLIMGVIPGTSIASNADEIKSRVQKVGKLNISGAAAAPAAATGAASTEATADSNGEGQQADPATLYQASCFACHGTGAAGSPVLGNIEAWAPRIAQGEATLLEHAINGFNAMPPRGGSMLKDDELKAVVAYIVENSQ